MIVEAKIELDAPAETALADIFQVEQAQLPDVLKPFASAALKEYVTMFLGQKVMRRGAEFLEYRLLLIIEHSPESTIPTEREVCRLFQATPSESRALIKRVLAKFQYQLRGAIWGSMRRLLVRAKQEKPGGNFEVAIDSPSLADELNGLLASIDGELRPIVKRRESFATYEIGPASMEQLRERLGAK